MLLWTLALACSDKADTGVDSTDTTPVVDSPDSDSPGDTTRDTDSNSDTPPDSDSPVDSDTPPQDDGLREVARDTTSYAALGYELITYELDPAIWGYVTIEGTNPSFQVLQPVGASGPVPTVFWMHGAASGDDSTSIPMVCTTTQIASNVDAIIDGLAHIPGEFARRGWALVLPYNIWCDGWFGKGPDDPVDPVNHWGGVHATNVANLVLDGELGYTPEPLYGWGTSAGGAGIFHFVAVHPEMGFDGLIVDSTSCDMITWYNQTTISDKPFLNHVMGGTPTEVPDRYQEFSCNLHLDEGRLTVPTFYTWNTRDLVSYFGQSQTITASMDATGLRMGHWDLNHEFPPPQNHVQSRVETPPIGGITGALMDFLEGATVLYQEAESMSRTCGSNPCVGSVAGVDTGGALADWRAFSQSAGIESNTAGDMVRYRIPSSVAAGATVDLIPLLTWSGTGSVDIVGIEYWENNALVKPVVAKSINYPTSTSTDDAIAQWYASLRLNTTVKLPPTAELRIVHKGNGTVRLDAVIVVVK